MRLVRRRSGIVVCMNADDDNQPEAEEAASPPPGLASPEAPKSTVDPDELAEAREQEQLHRKLQEQGEDDDPRPPAQRQRDEAVDAAIEDVERSIESGRERTRRDAETSDD